MTTLYQKVLARKKSGSHRAVGLKAIFLASKEDIADAVNHGCSLKSIWNVLHDEKEFEGSYKTFCTYAKKHIGTNKSRVTPSIPPLSQPKINNKKSETPTNNEIKTFEWSADYDPKDLVGE